MFGIGPTELIVILVIGLLVLGPKRLPDLARSLGRAMAEFRKATADITTELDNARIMLEEETRAASQASRDADKRGRGYGETERVAAGSPAAEPHAGPPAAGADATAQPAPDREPAAAPSAGPSASKPV
jgi:sec-independent protein translocase protein TatB